MRVNLPEERIKPKRFPPLNDSRIMVFLSALGLALMLAMVWHARGAAGGGVSDFAAFYAGAKLLEEGKLYDADRLQQIELAHAGKYAPRHGYVRPPFHAAMVWPLSRLDYARAALVWNALQAAALLGFVVLWRRPRWEFTLLFTCISVPAFSGFINGQDGAFVLFFLALAVYLHRCGHPFMAGIALSLCAAKFHLFLPIPLWIVGQRAWRLGGGLVAGGTALLLVSFLLAGWSWPLELYASATRPEFSPHPGLMPNLHGVLAAFPRGFWPEILMSGGLALTTWLVARKTDFHYSLAFTLACGLLLSYHAYVPDMVLLLPAGLTIVFASKLRVVRVLATVLLLPPAAFAVILGSPTSAVTVSGVVLLLALMTYEALVQGADGMVSLPR